MPTHIAKCWGHGTPQPNDDLASKLEGITSDVRELRTAIAQLLQHDQNIEAVTTVDDQVQSNDDHDVTVEESEVEKPPNPQTQPASPSRHNASIASVEEFMPEIPDIPANQLNSPLTSQLL